MYRSCENIDISISIYHPMKLTPQYLEGLSDESTSETYINKLTLVIWKCVYNRVVYVVKK